MDTLTPTLNQQQLTQNIDAMQAQGVSTNDVQAYVDNYSKSNDGSYTLKNSQKTNQDPNSFRYQVPKTPTDNATNLANAKVAATKAQTDSDYANSPLGLIMNTVGAAGSTLANSEIGLGNTMGSIFNTQDGTLDSLLDSQKRATQTQLALMKEITKMKNEGKDPTSAMRAYNSAANLTDEINGQIKEITTGAQKSTGQVLGELGGTALDLLTAGSYGAVTKGMKAGELTVKTPSIIKGAIDTTVKPSGLLTRAGATKVLKGAGLGYGYDVTGNLKEGKTGSDVLTPGLGTLIGGGIPGATEGTQSILNKVGSTKEFIAATPASILSKRASSIDAVNNANGALRTLSDKAMANGIDVKDLIAKSDLMVGTVDDNGVIRTLEKGGPVDKFDEAVLDQRESVVSDALKQEGTTIPLTRASAIKQGLNPATSMEARLDADLAGSNVAGASKKSFANANKAEIEGLMLDADKDGNIDLSKIQDAKITNAKMVNWNDVESRTAKKAIAGVEGQIIEDTSKSPHVHELNKELQKYYTVRDYLEALDGKRVKGGKLGKYFAETIGAMVGSHFGPFGTLVGGYVGNQVSGNSMSNSMGGKLGNNIFAPSPLMLRTIEENKIKQGSLPLSGNASDPSMQELPLIPKSR